MTKQSKMPWKIFPPRSVNFSDIVPLTVEQAKNLWEGANEILEHFKHVPQDILYPPDRTNLYEAIAKLKKGLGRE